MKMEGIGFVVSSLKVPQNCRNKAKRKTADLLVKTSEIIPTSILSEIKFLS